MVKGRQGGKKTNKFMNFMMYIRETKEECQTLTMPELQSYCGPLWEKMSLQEKAGFKYGDATKAPGNYLTGEGCKYDTLGREMSLVRAMKSEKDEREVLVRQFIANEIQSLGSKKRVIEMPFFVVDVRLWVTTLEGDVVPAEIAILKMNIKSGVEDTFHCLLHPSKIPDGYSSTALKFIEKFKIDYYDDKVRDRILRQDYEKVFQEMASFIHSYKGNAPASAIRKNGSLNPLYYLPPQDVCEKYKKNAVEKSLDWLAEKAGFEEGFIPVMDLSQLFYQFHARLKPSDVQSVVPSQIMGAFWLEQDKYIYQEGLKCPHHKEEYDIDNSVCALSKIKIQAFIFVEFCSKFVENAVLIPGKHLPHENTEKSTYEDDETYDIVDDEDGDEDERTTTIYAESTQSGDDDDDFKSALERSFVSEIDFEQESFSSAQYNEWKKRFWLSGRSTPNSSQILKATRSRPPPTPSRSSTPTASYDPVFKFSGLKL